MKVDEYILFNIIYEKLIVHHEINQMYIIEGKNIESTILKRLKQLLKDENIDFTEKNGQLICSLDEKGKEIAQSVYTPETIKKLKEEERRLDKEFMKDFIFPVKDK